MAQLSYVTSNQSKFRNAQQFFTGHAIELQQCILQLYEIQAESSQEIALAKVRKAYDKAQTPLFVNDASWHLPALGGFPGPYMKYINEWLDFDDILNLMRSKSDRTIILKDVVAYKDDHIEKVFINEVRGRLLEAPTGETNGPFMTRLISFDDGGKSLAMVRSGGYTERELPLWEEFVGWLKECR